MNRRIFSKSIFGSLLGFLGVKTIQAEQDYQFILKELDLTRHFISKQGELILHRLNGPAIEYTNGDKHWYKNGLLHREDGPAIEYGCGDFLYFVNGKLHRIDGPAINYAKSWQGSYQAWYENGLCHRLNNPAVICEGLYDQWWINGEIIKTIDYRGIPKNG